MNDSNEQTFKRATTAALAGLFSHLLLLALMFLSSLHAGAPAMYAATWHLVGGVFIWIVLCMLYNQYRLEQIEVLEAQQLAESDAQAAAMFGEGAAEIGVARGRRKNIEKYGLNIVAFLVAGLNIGLGFYLLASNLRAAKAGTLPDQAIAEGASVPLLTLIFAASSFISFLVARWIAGTTSVKQWQGLRAGAATLMGVVLMNVLLLAAAVFMYFGETQGFVVAAVILPVIMILLGLEILFSWLLGLYRPRRTDDFVRPAFDSRVLGWLTRPESIGRSINEMINYQFGYEVSQSWFMKLLITSLMPLVAACILLVVLMTSVVIVAPQQKAVISRMGKKVAVKDSGLRWKLPWPFGKAEKFDVYRVHQIIVGSRGAQLDMNAAILWTNVHMTEGEEQFLVTAPIKSDEANQTTDIAAGELVGADVFVKYRIKEDGLWSYVTSAEDPKLYVKILSERAVNRYFATKNIDQLLSTDRLEAGQILYKAIREEVEQASLGIEIVFVSVSGVHPPQKSSVADRFHEYIGAFQERRSELEKAERDAIMTLAEVAGSRDKALEIDKAIVELGELRRALTGDETKSRQSFNRKALQIEQLLDDAGGTAAQSLLEARAYRWERAISEMGSAHRFKAELLAYRHAPEYYRAKQYLDALGQGLQGRRKVIIYSPEGNSPVIRLDAKTKRTGADTIFKDEE